ncbi:MAG: nucleotidyltransferase family protein [Candidatus Omnitrophota bacterium]
MVSIILLAAGESKRFGSPKQLAKINSTTLIEYLISKLEKTKVDEIIVVLGAYKEKIEKLIPSYIKIATNKDYQEGQTSSLKIGLENISSDAKYFLVLPVDIPAISAETIDFVIDKFINSKFLIGIPSYKNQKGHPPIYSIKLKNQILELKNNKPLYTINHQFIGQTLDIPVDDKNILFNINTPEDLEKIRKSIF